MQNTNSLSVKSVIDLCLYEKAMQTWQKKAHLLVLKRVATSTYT